MATGRLDAVSFTFYPPLEGGESKYSVGIVAREGDAAYTVVFNRIDGTVGRESFGVDLPEGTGIRADSDEIEAVCRRAISSALASGIFFDEDTHSIRYDEYQPLWGGNFRVV
ncbi:hypothetical protein PAN31117_03148 [Pandoraea anapnoica]|uniref:Uncharacterized protein n=1 Tax=Pandoraea anapnoica TaxID=2508301 RepID=A0A5E5A8Q0_9BURK|nr:hypothetical protein [Pandoraea anapnoica]VVE68915.1 hypothetical protein PAN31117_03148 [Pandoraea anapnoica]